MRTSSPPIIAAWILHRFGPSPETDVIAGDLLEEYQQGRSRLWYWREAIVAILTGTWSEVKQHSLSLLGAIAVGWILDLAWHSVITPFEYSLIEYLFDRPTSAWQFSFHKFLSEVPLAVMIGWTTARLARRLRIPAVFGMAGSLMVVGVWNVLKVAQIAWASPYPFHFSVWLAFLCPIPLLTVLVLFGGGLLTGSPKRSIRT
jgi:hypothetical protein